MDLLGGFLMPSLMLLMFFAVLVLSKLLALIQLMIRNCWLNGSAKGKLPKEGLMDAHKNCLMCVILGGYTQPSA